ncbi:efflux RND transporter periplasmic adaptor subunit [Bacteroides sp. GM023]|uniref:efflux RND transporter periplasmic adaptor subunit n=1 Tax=Bacteroides sp. GM023 TaxID=2723058 RepID=UPI00168B0A4A|nr:efflux RND transporter periplasmic adaptor subunit [Bacteroides sp. GM023]MBD3589075.1 efflux RND transporter periplasmic adaptor subunit [Bacteroides sp. GM023]
MTTTRFLLCIFCLCLLASCGKGEKKADEPVRVKVAEAETLIPSSEREFSFISKPFKETELSFRVGGPIDRFEVYAGNFYHRGDMIAEIDSRDFRIRKERAEAIYNQAKAEFERIKVLYEKNNLSASAYEKARADYTSAKTAFETATNELNDTRLVAPFDGYVGEVYIEKFQDVKATQPVVSFIDITQLKIEAYVTQDIALQAEKIKEVGVRFDVRSDAVYPAKVVEVSKSTTRNNLSFLLTALLPNKQGEWPAGISGKMLLDLPVASPAPMVAVPQTALSHRPTEGDYVWTVDNTTGTVSKKKVVLGELLPNGKVEVKGGLQAGETVAVSKLRFLSEGTSVEVMGKKQEKPVTAQK